MSEATDGISCPGFTTKAWMCQRRHEQRSPSQSHSDISDLKHIEAICCHEKHESSVDSILNKTHLENSTTTLPGNEKDDAQALTSGNMANVNLESENLVSQLQWSEPLGQNSAHVLDDSIEHITCRMGLDQRCRPTEPTMQLQNSADFWASLASDVFVFPPNDMYTSSLADSLGPYSIYPDSTAVTSVEPDAATFHMTSTYQEPAATEQSGSDANHCTAINLHNVESWTERSRAESSTVCESMYQPAPRNTYSDIEMSATEPQFDMGWPTLPDLEYTWEQDVVGLYGQEDLILDTDLGQPTSYPPLPDLAPLTAYNSFVTQTTCQHTDLLMSRWRNQDMNDFTQNHGQTVLPSIEGNDDDFTWNMLQPQYSKSSTPSVLGRQSQTSSIRKAEDEFLIDCKDKKKMSYKAIKALGGFREAESTLRGRYRTLSKLKEERVRKPEWSERDIHILKQIVAQFLYRSSSISSDHTYPNNRKEQQHALNKISWKKVAESMAVRGCYKFGNATVKKKYMEVMGIPRRANSY